MTSMRVHPLLPKESERGKGESPSVLVMQAILRLLRLTRTDVSLIEFAEKSNLLPITAYHSVLVTEKDDFLGLD